MGRSLSLNRQKSPRNPTFASIIAGCFAKSFSAFMRFVRRPTPQPSQEVNRKAAASSSEAGRGAGSAITIGNFDGVHRGHQTLLKQVAQEAREHGLVPTVLTLSPHPRELFDPSFRLARISTLRDRVSAMKAAGIEQICILPFDRQIAALPASQFVEDILVKQLNMKSLWVGDDFRFGAGRQGDLSLLKSLSSQMGFKVKELPEVQKEGARVSSSNIRKALTEGNVALAASLLDRPLCYSGRVLHGKKLGRTLGFPTMNLAFKGKASALSGILAVWVHGLDSRPMAGVASLGVRPTVEQSDKILLETFIPNWSGNAYGKLIQVEISAHLRPEKHFSDMDLMVQQMKLDTKLALDWLANNPSRL